MVKTFKKHLRSIHYQEKDLLPVHVYVKSDLNIHCMTIIIIMIITIVIISIIRRKTPVPLSLF